MYKYHLVNKNSPINTTWWALDMDYIVNELLIIVDNSLAVFVNNNIKVPAETLSFDHLQIIQTMNGINSNPYITDIFNFNINTLSFISSSHSTNIPISLSFKIITDSIKNKLNLINTNITKPNSNIINLNSKPKKIFTQKQSKVKSDFTPLDPSSMISQITEPDILNRKRLIPTMESSSSESESSSSDDESIINLETFEENSENLDLEMMKKTIDDLQRRKVEEEKKLNELKSFMTNDTENFSRYCHDLGDRKRTMRKNLDKAAEQRSRFEANKLAFYKMKKHISEGKLDKANISDLFVNEYPIYEFMDSKELLDTPHDFITYLSIYNELYPSTNTEEEESTYVPHNINYLSEEEQEKYKDIKTNNKDLIEEFMSNSSNNSNQQKKYPPLDDILNAIDADESICLNSDINFEKEAQI